MPNPWLIVGALLAIAAAYFGGEYRGSAAKDMEWQAKTYAELAEKSEAARNQESMWQGVVNGTVKNDQARADGIRRTLDIALDSLRHRPERAAGVSEAPRSACAGGTGAELSRADAEFLEREAARAERQRSGLIACYEVIDGTR